MIFHQNFELYLKTDNIHLRLYKIHYKYLRVDGFFRLYKIFYKGFYGVV